MSANNSLLIRKEQLLYKGYDIFVEEDTIEDYDPVFTAETLEEAIQMANKYMQENVVEYGTSFDI
jgi:hypothetical protein